MDFMIFAALMYISYLVGISHEELRRIAHALEKKNGKDG